MYTTFIHYSIPEDATLAKRIYVDLLKGGARPWVDPYDRIPGESVEEAQNRAFELCEHMVVLLTRQYQRDEKALAFTNQAITEGKTIIPILADRGVKTDLPDPIQLKRRYSQAIEALAERVPIDTEPLEDVPVWQDGNDAYHNGFYKEAIELYNKMPFENAIEYHSLATAQNAMRNHEEALEAINKAIELDDSNPMFYRNQSVALSGLNRNEDALAADQKAVELAGDDARNWSTYAMTLNMLERHDDALKAIQKATELEPQTPRFHYQEGVIKAKGEKLEDALTSFERVLELDPEHEPATIWRRKVWGQLGMGDKALAEVNQAIKKHPRRGGNYINRSLIHYYLENYEAAIEDATAAIMRGTESQVPGLFNRAISHWKLGNEEDAKKDFAQMLALEPELGEEMAIRSNAESDLTADPAVEILRALEEVANEFIENEENAS